MSDIIRVDARGLSCPEPVIQTKQAMRLSGVTGVEVMVDSGASRDNVKRAAEKANWNVEVAELAGGVFRLDLKK